jgi:hypothetical protein
LRPETADPTAAPGTITESENIVENVISNEDW